MARTVNLADYDYVFYTTKSGVDTKTGLSVAQARLTVNSTANLIKNATYNGKKVLHVIGPGTYTETISVYGSGYTGNITMYGDYDGTLTGQTAGEIIITNTSGTVLNHANLIECFNITIKNTGTSSSSYAIGAYLATLASLTYKCIFDNCIINSFTTFASLYPYTSVDLNNSTILNTAVSNSVILTKTDATTYGGAKFVFNNTTISATNIAFTSTGQSTANTVMSNIEVLSPVSFFFNSCILQSTSTSAQNIYGCSQFVQFNNCTISFVPSAIGIIRTELTMGGQCEFNGGYIKSITNENITNIEQWFEPAFTSVLSTADYIKNFVIDKYYETQNGGIKFINVNDTNCNIFNTGIFQIASAKTYNNETAKYFYNKTAANPTEVVYQFPATSGTELTINVPLTGTEDGTVNLYIYKSGQTFSDYITTSAVTITAGDTFTVGQITFTPDKDGFYYLRISRPNQTNNVIEQGTITIS